MKPETQAAGCRTSPPLCSAWTVDFNGPWGPERCEYKNPRPIPEQTVRDRFAMDRPLCSIVRVTPNIRGESLPPQGETK